MNKSKYGNKKLEIGSEKFDSKLEYNRWLFLLDQQRAGKISGLERQVKYELIPHQTEEVIVHQKTKDKVATRVVEQAVHYVADFVYNKPNQCLKVIEDTKSAATRKKESYIIKRKLMAIKGWHIREVTRATEEV